MVALGMAVASKVQFQILDLVLVVIRGPILPGSLHTSTHTQRLWSESFAITLVAHQVADFGLTGISAHSNESLSLTLQLLEK